MRDSQKHFRDFFSIELFLFASIDLDSHRPEEKNTKPKSASLVNRDKYSKTTIILPKHIQVPERIE